MCGAKSKILAHGTGKSWHIPDDLWHEITTRQLKWEAHSHPTVSVKLNPSPEDIETLKQFTWQEKSYIIDLNGNTQEFSKDMQEWYNSQLGVK